MQALETESDKQDLAIRALSNIYELEAAIEALPESIGKDAPAFKYNHRFVPGIYSREITIPENTLLTTEIHASENIAVVLKGSFTFYSESGIEYIEAPRVFITKVGTKRAMYTHTEVVFLTFHQNLDNETDMDILTERYTFADQGEYQQYLQKLLEKN